MLSSLHGASHPPLPLQVCNLAWSPTGNEIVSSHGYSLNHVGVWAAPSLAKLALLRGHTARVRPGHML